MVTEVCNTYVPGIFNATIKEESTRARHVIAKDAPTLVVIMFLGKKADVIDLEQIY